jgi:3-hydroxyisobutyrate dehydrogenase-like beta-hydroxyacid dehydrogenase
MKIAFLGLGQMGTPMSRRLLDAGHDVAVWNRTRARAESLAVHGARVADSPAEAVAGTEVAITMLSDAQAVEQVVFGNDGAAAAMDGGRTLVQMSTIGPEAERTIRERMPDGVDAIDAPVLGSVPQATDGTLRIFVGATDEQLEGVRAALDAMGTVFHMGGPGAGAAMKLVANSTIGAVISAIGEALVLADAAGLRREDVLEILADSPVGTTVQRKRSNFESHSYPANFKLRHLAKDMRLIQADAERLGVDLEVVAAAAAWLDRALVEGHGDEDYSSAVESIAPPRQWS